MKRITLTENRLKQLIKNTVSSIISENFGGSYASVRPYSNKLIDMIDDGLVDSKTIAKDLIGWMDDRDVKRFMEVNELDTEDEEEEEDDFEMS